MGRLTGLVAAVNLFTGRSGRHNRALRDITDLATTIQEFLQRYHLQEESPGFRFLSEDLGTVKVELTTITYHTHPLIKAAKSIMGTEVAPALEEVYNDLEEVRRALINPLRGNTNPGEALAKLHISFQELTNIISETEYR